MNSRGKECAEQEAADQVEERRVAREDARWSKECWQILRERDALFARRGELDYRVPPYLFADERSQRRVEEEARQERPLDDYDTWTGQNQRLFR